MMQLTLGFSIFYALIVMPAILATIGPNKYFGDIWRPLKKLIMMLKRKICAKTKKVHDDVKDDDVFEDLAK